VRIDAADFGLTVDGGIDDADPVRALQTAQPKYKIIEGGLFQAYPYQVLTIGLYSLHRRT
jgi:hypothetical protein